MDEYDPEPDLLEALGAIDRAASKLAWCRRPNVAAELARARSSVVRVYRDGKADRPRERARPRAMAT